MRKKIIFLAVVAGAFLSFSSCISTKKTVQDHRTEQKKESYTPEMQKSISQYPDIIGFEKRAIFLSKPDDGTKEDDMKIEIIPGRELLVDCNQYGLQGEMMKRTMKKNGLTYFLFNSNGQVFSTMMGCPDDAKVKKYVSGQSVMTEYRSATPIVVYTSRFIDVKYSLWKTGKMENIDSKRNFNNADEAVSNLKNFPATKDGYERHVLYLPAIAYDDALNRKIEIIPAKQMKVDCNNHFLIGSIIKETVEGFGYEYLTFESDGRVGSTRMACPDGVMKEKLITGATELLPYNSKLPVVVFAPKGLDVNFRIWETNGKLY